MRSARGVGGAEARSATSASAEASANERAAALLRRVEELEGNAADAEAAAVRGGGRRKAAEREVSAAKAAAAAARGGGGEREGGDGGGEGGDRGGEGGDRSPSSRAATVSRPKPAKTRALSVAARGRPARNRDAGPRRRRARREGGGGRGARRPERRAAETEAEAKRAVVAIDARIADLQAKLGGTAKRDGRGGDRGSPRPAASASASAPLGREARRELEALQPERRVVPAKSPHAAMKAAIGGGVRARAARGRAAPPRKRRPSRGASALRARGGTPLTRAPSGTRALGGGEEADAASSKARRSSAGRCPPSKRRGRAPAARRRSARR